MYVVFLIQLLIFEKILGVNFTVIWKKKFRFMNLNLERVCRINIHCVYKVAMKIMKTPMKKKVARLCLDTFFTISR